MCASPRLAGRGWGGGDGFLDCSGGGLHETSMACGSRGCEKGAVEAMGGSARGGGAKVGWWICGFVTRGILNRTVLGVRRGRGCVSGAVERAARGGGLDPGACSDGGSGVEVEAAPASP